MAKLPDGLDALRNAIPTKDIIKFIEHTALWAAPETFALLPLWYPEHWRKGLFYKSGWTEEQFNKSRTTGVSTHKAEGNLYANSALTAALGLKKNERKNWSCCHLWGIDDPTYQKTNEVVQDNRFYSCIGNMVLLPTPLKAFTDSMPEVKSVLRLCARNLYGWQCDHQSMKSTNKALEQWSNWEIYPDSWPKELGEKLPKGVQKLTPEIQKRAKSRLSKIKNDIENAGEFYPREKVIEALEYWKITI